MKRFRFSFSMTNFEAEGAAGIAAVAPAAAIPNGVGGKKRPKEALLLTYGIGFAAKDYKRIARPAAQIELT